MDCLVYHGSENGNLKIIEPKVSTHQKSCVYATDNKCTALLFIGKGNGDLDTLIGTINGELTLVERRDGVLDAWYNHSGYIYVLDGSTFNHYDYLWSKEVISFEAVKVIEKIKIPNILKEIENEELKGNIKVYRYPNRPSTIPLDNSDLIEKYIDFEKQGLIGSIDQLLKIYPEFKDRIKTYD